MTPTPYNRTQLMDNPPERTEFSNGDQKPPPRKLGGLVVVAVILIIVGLVAGLLPRSRQRHNLVDESKDLALTTVTAVSPAPGQSVTATFLPAEVRPLMEAPIYARANGYLKKWY